MGTNGKVLAVIFELTFAEIIRHIDEMKFMRDIGMLKQRPKPGSLFLCVAGEIEYDGFAFGE